MARLLRLLLIGALGVPLHGGQAAPTVPTTIAGASTTLFVSMARVAPDLVGAYNCLEYEFGLVWTSEVVTLRPGGASVYAYAPPYTSIVTGTWVYTPTTMTIEFTNFRWLTATVQLPNRLSASKYLPQAGFEVALSCQKT